ncbi:AbrB/MazE/SpoVT family DNA-binding domain-containing protein [Occultella gossypii]|uniref:AbrB/MazE/SpoVT family DNA-binding domain-containing protein n=1 Tax=Occultella gossypii TaxID=2800820 RepID=A0ABS7S9B6_9MICO|nr:AbrB/MazE/SpoVT family DNA-binding domain-containing protein [Occultella gossypii]MBZ2195881.1 AbrB/MazE/SpoVT family DNA-binding domain-containing protein [Occultella gossypii]
MRTTIDSAGRIVVPKALRDAMDLAPGRAIEIIYADGRLEIEVIATDVEVERVDGLPIAVPADDLPALTVETVRATLEEARR